MISLLAASVFAFLLWSSLLATLGFAVYIMCVAQVEDEADTQISTFRNMKEN